MTALTLTGNFLCKAEMEYNGNFGHTLGRIQKISLMIRIDICYTAWRLSNKTVAPNLSGFQGLKHCIQYLASHPHKTIFYHYNSYDDLNVIRLTQSGNQVEEYTTQNCLKWHQYEDHAKTLNRKWSFLLLFILSLLLLFPGNYRFK